jgi:hypothetical protein
VQYVGSDHGQRQAAYTVVGAGGAVGIRRHRSRGRRRVRATGSRSTRVRPRPRLTLTCRPTSRTCSVSDGRRR